MAISPIMLTFISLLLVLSLKNISGFTKLKPLSSGFTKLNPISSRQVDRNIKLQVLPDMNVALYDAQLQFSHLVETEMTQVSPLSTFLLYSAGLLTAFSPCAMSLLPVTIAFLGGNENTNSNVIDSNNNNINNNNENTINSILYALGLASTLSIFGVLAASLGSMYGTSTTNSDISDFISTIISFVIILMGLNLLELLPFDFPSFTVGDDKLSSTNARVRSFGLGASAALVASPCSSPVLTSLLAVISSSGNPYLGACLLFAYSLGYATPVVTAATFSRSLATNSNINNINESSNSFGSTGAPWVNTLLASVLVFYGTFSLCDNVWGKLA